MLLKALVVDDSPIVRNLHSAMLRSEDFEVIEAENGQVALEKIGRGHFDVILVDINMPKMDGFTFCKKLRSDFSNNETPVIVISTEEDESDKMEAIKSGANLYLIKPVSKSELISNIKMLVE